MKFKTNIKCNGCIQTIRPYLDNLKEIKQWSVDLNTPERILTTEGDHLDEVQIINAVRAAGYQADRIN